MTDLVTSAPLVPVENLRSLLSFAMAIQTADASSNFPDFPLDNAEKVAKMMVIKTFRKS